MRETVIWNHERMPIIDGMPASVPDGQPHTHLNHGRKTNEPNRR